MLIQEFACSDDQARPSSDRVSAACRDYWAVVRGTALRSTRARTVLLLAAEGATGEEMSLRLGRTAGATRTLLCRARLALRARLAEIDSESVAPAATFRTVAEVA